jgi:hypothetical protein
MTAAERQQRKRDRQKAGLVRVEVWVPADKAQAVRDAVAEVAGWQPVENAPYETPVLTYWPGNKMRNPVIIINTKNSGASLGKRDGWWHSVPDQTPTHWMPLPGPPTIQRGEAQDRWIAMDYVAPSVCIPATSDAKPGPAMTWRAVPEEDYQLIQRMRSKTIPSDASPDPALDSE